MKHQGRHQLVTANRLADGRVVYLTATGDWSADIGASAVAADAEAAARLLTIAEAAAARQIVVEPYLIPVVTETGAIRPVRYREAIRAFGPSVRSDLARQATASTHGEPHVPL